MDKVREIKPKHQKPKHQPAKTNSATEKALRRALEKDRPTLTYNCKPYQNPKTRPLEPERAN